MCSAKREIAGKQERKTGLAAGHGKTVLDGEILGVGFVQRNPTLPTSHQYAIVLGARFVHPGEAIDTVSLGDPIVPSSGYDALTRTTWLEIKHFSYQPGCRGPHKGAARHLCVTKQSQPLPLVLSRA